MIFVLDTNFLSEGAKPIPDTAVMAFIRAVPVESIRLSAIVLGELVQGVENNPTANLKQFLAEVWALGHCPGFDDRGDGGVRGWAVAMRNTDDFKPLGLSVFNPWTDRL